MTSALICIMTLMINQSNEDWNDIDMEHVARAKVGCAQKYPDAPCLTKFIKKEPLVYTAVCGTKKERQ